MMGRCVQPLPSGSRIQAPAASAPPSTWTVVPETQPDRRSEARNSTAPAESEAAPGRAHHGQRRHGEPAAAQHPHRGVDELLLGSTQDEIMAALGAPDREAEDAEREKLGGLSPLAYVGSKVIFLGVFVLAQSLWMGLFVEMITGGLPGDLVIKLALLVLASAAMTAVCLGISATSRTPEKATILSIYLVGFQLPLSGAVLTLPDWLENWVQPLIAAFWSWSGSLSSMRSTAFYDAVKQVTSTDLIGPGIAGFVLFVHVLVGLGMTFIGVQRSQWDS